MPTPDPTTPNEPAASATARLFRAIPAVNEVVESPPLDEWRTRLPHAVLVEAARTVLVDLRQAVASGHEGAVPAIAELARRVAGRLESEDRPRLRPVINATGIILHTGLGRAPLAEAAVTALADVARNYASVELDLDTGERGKRTGIVRDLLARLTGAESATVVNNNAAATMIVLAAVAKGRSVIVSRGELIEIGGSFRLPEIMEVSGARLREVGTTNKTRLADYERAIDDSTAALMKVHTSNYRIMGFTESVSVDALVGLGRRRGLPVIDDIGSGALVDYGRFGFTEEPVAAASVAAGADLVLFSGDKLLGGPQAGVIVGRRDWIDRIEKNPLMRAFRVDKLTLAALQATLRLYRDPERAVRELPILAAIRTPLAELRDRATRLAAQLRQLPGVADAAVADDTAYLGGGSLPDQGLPTSVVRLRPSAMTEGELATRLRVGSPAVVPRVQDGYVIFDLRTVFPQQVADLARAIAASAE
jgi:L-seryl-tRNA(Ser) seleniumtransferase